MPVRPVWTGRGSVSAAWPGSPRYYGYLLIGGTIAVYKRGTSAAIRRAALASMVLVVIQITVAAALILHHLPSSMRVLHLVVGAALWMALVLWATRARRQAAWLDRGPG